MATVQKTWSFDTTVESFTLESETGAGTGSVTWDSNNATLQLLYTRNTATAEDFDFIISLSAEASWESLGVPAGGTVTSVGLANIDIATDGTNPGGDRDLTSAELNMFIFDGATQVAQVLTVYTLPTIDNTTYFYDTFYGTAGDSNVAVGASHQASTTTVNLKLVFSFSSAGLLTANFSNFIDNITLDINYTPAATGTRYFLIT